MEERTEVTTISGGWIGEYSYVGVLTGCEPVAFEASFNDLGRGSFTGDILDEDERDGAVISGGQQGAVIRFVRANAPTHTMHPVERIWFAGRISADASVVRGTWRSDGAPRDRASGTWFARRTWSDE